MSSVINILIAIPTHGIPSDALAATFAFPSAT